MGSELSCQTCSGGVGTVQAFPAGGGHEFFTCVLAFRVCEFMVIFPTEQASSLGDSRHLCCDKNLPLLRPSEISTIPIETTSIPSSIAVPISPSATPPAVTPAACGWWGGDNVNFFSLLRGGRLARRF